MPALAKVVRYLRRVAGPRASEEPSDGLLLARFVATQEEAAFATLLARHGGLVLGVCRRVLDDPNDVDDAFQATFLVLVRKAASIAKGESVASWLYGVAYRTAQRARCATARRRAYERRAPIMPTINPSSAADWSDLRPVLDDELSRLPEKYRAPLVLCYLEGKTNDEAAGLLGWTKGTVSGRLARARDLLRRRLTRRGITLSSAALAGLLSGQAASAATVPTALAAGTLRSAVAVAAAKTVTTGVVSASVAKLTQGVLHVMLLNKIKSAALVLVALGVLGVGAGVILSHGADAGRGTDKTDGTNQPLAAADDQEKPRAKNAGKKEDKELLQGLWNLAAVSDDSSKPPPEMFEKVKMYFEGDKIFGLEGDGAQKGTFVLAPEKMPKEIDLVFGNQNTSKAIYEIAGDELRLCFTQGEAPRPTSFKGDPAKTQVFATFKRETDPAKVKAYKDKLEQSSGSSGDVARSANNLRQIAIAMHNYAAQNGHLPPAAIYSKDGKPLLSWRVLILPYIEQDHLFRQFHLDEPWDSEHNKKLANTVIPRPYVPVGGASGVKDKTVTYFRVFTGPGTLFEGTKGITFADIRDGTSNTILCVEAGEPVVWTKPDELPYDAKKPLPKLGGLFNGSFNLLRADGSTQFVKPGFDEALFRLGITRNDGQPIDLSKLNK